MGKVSRWSMAVVPLVVGIALSIWAVRIWLEAPGENIGIAVFAVVGWTAAIVFYAGQARAGADRAEEGQAVEAARAGVVARPPDVDDVKSGAAAGSARSARPAGARASGSRSGPPASPSSAGSSSTTPEGAPNDATPARTAAGPASALPADRPRGPTRNEGGAPMQGRDESAAPDAASSVARFVLVLILVAAAVLGARLALDYPRFQPDCGPQAGGPALAHCEAVTSLAGPLSATSAM